MFEVQLNLNVFLVFRAPDGLVASASRVKVPAQSQLVGRGGEGQTFTVLASHRKEN